MATQAAVGLYGGAYRLLESSLFITYALTGAFAPMYTYLGPETEPPIGATFQRSLKLALVALVPIAAVFGVLAERSAASCSARASRAPPTRCASSLPVVVLIGVVTLASSLIVSRRNPMLMVWSTAAIALLNVVLNSPLIPAWDERPAPRRRCS